MAPQMRGFFFGDDIMSKIKADLHFNYEIEHKKVIYKQGYAYHLEMPKADIDALLRRGCIYAEKDAKYYKEEKKVEVKKVIKETKKVVDDVVKEEEKVTKDVADKNSKQTEIQKASTEGNEPKK